MSIGSNPAGTLMRERVVVPCLYTPCASIQSWVSRGQGQGQREAEGFHGSVNEVFRNYFVNSVAGEWGSAPFLPFLNFLS